MDDELQTMKTAGPQQRMPLKSSEAVVQLWTPPPSQWKLRSGEVHVWSVSLEQTKTGIDALAATLSAEEKRKAAQFRFETIREQWTIGRGALRQLLAAYTGSDPSGTCFEYGANGKPALASRAKALHFNFSHSGKLALCAISSEEPVGVDVEKICFMSEAGAIAKTCFSPEERIEFQCASAAEKQRTFYRIWTRKEAVLKWSGRGIGNKEEALSSGTGFDGYLQELLPASGFIGCLAIQKQPRAVQLWQWRPH